jgi:uncharacterized protein (TIGR02646 family)
MKLFVFHKPNFRCRVSKKGENGKRFWRLCYAEDEAKAQEFLEGRNLVVHKIDPYDFENEWQVSAQEETDKATAARQAGQSWEFKPLWGVLKEHLFDLTDGRCAYCEAVCKHVGYGDVEHYRPKAKVTEDDTHPGYYWLAYDRENYLPSCQICNQYVKKSHFPIAPGGVRAQQPGDSLEDEQALLLNPSVHDYEQHLEFVPSDETENPGYAKGISDEGKETIELMELNRDTLVDLRRQEQGSVQQALKMAFIQAITENNPGRLARFISNVHSGTRQFLTAAVCEINAFYKTWGLAPPFE